MSPDDLKTILERLKKPLRYASRDDFAHLKSLTDLEPFVLTQVRELRRLSGDNRGTAALEDLFSGFDALALDRKRSHILQAIAAIDAFGRDATPRPDNGPEQLCKSANETTNLHFDTQVQYCKGVGPKRAALMKKRGIARSRTPCPIFPGDTRIGVI